MIFYQSDVQHLLYANYSSRFLSLNPQLSLTESEISKIGTIKVEGIINPTNAEMDLKDGVGEEDIFLCLFYFFMNKSSGLSLPIQSCASCFAVFRQRPGESRRPGVPGGS